MDYSICYMGKIGQTFGGEQSYISILHMYTYKYFNIKYKIRSIKVL